MRDRRLWRLAPQLSRIVEPEDLGVVATPLRSEPGLAAALGLRELWVKRDDLSHPAYGGSKVRALEMHLGAARGRPGVFTVGPWGSHHVVATAVFARRCGLPVHALLVPQPQTPEVPGAKERLEALGVEVTWCERTWDVPFAALRAVWRARGCLTIPPGGTSPLGVLGLAEVGLELAAAAERGDIPFPDRIVVPVGSAGTVAGILLGLGLAGQPIPVDGVRVVPPWWAPRRRVSSLVRSALRLIARSGWRPPFRLPPLRLVDGVVGPGYGHPTESGRQLAQLVQETGTFRVETTYTAKALSILLRPEFRGQRVWFHTTYSAVEPEVGDPPFG